MIESTAQSIHLGHPQVDGAVTSGPDLSVEVNGMRLPNPFVIGSGVCMVHATVYIC